MKHVSLMCAVGHIRIAYFIQGILSTFVLLKLVVFSWLLAFTRGSNKMTCFIFEEVPMVPILLLQPRDHTEQGNFVLWWLVSSLYIKLTIFPVGTIKRYLNESMAKWSPRSESFSNRTAVFIINLKDLWSLLWLYLMALIFSLYHYKMQTLLNKN